MTPTATPFVVIEPSASLTSVVTPITSPTKTAVGAVTEMLTTIACERDTASLALSASAMTLKKGDAVTVTATLMNGGCVGLGLPQYRLYVQAEGTEPILTPDKPAPIVHELAVAPGRSDATTFSLRAVSAGRVTLNASASYEVHLGYPGPAYLGSASSQSLVIAVTP